MPFCVVSPKRKLFLLLELKGEETFPSLNHETMSFIDAENVNIRLQLLKWNFNKMKQFRGVFFSVPQKS